MITVVERGLYRLIETKNQTKILILDGQETYAWINARGIGEILVASHRSHLADSILSLGNYRLYDVINEPHLTDQMHLELSIGLGMWQGYLLPNGFPTEEKTRHRIIPTQELITTFSKEAGPLAYPSYAQ